MFGKFRPWSCRINVILFIFLLLGVLLTFVNISKLISAQESLKNNCKKTFKYAIYGKHLESGYLDHVFEIFNRAGFSRTNISKMDWDILWAHDYPFNKLKQLLVHLKPSQKINKLPGSGFVTNKVNLATSSQQYIPKAFKIPNEKEELRQYGAQNPSIMFVQKNKNHRGIQIEDIAHLDLNSEGSFIQEFIDNPLLIDGYKFDIGIYTIITSIDPLRIYVFDADALFRFCPEKYYPFDKKNTNKYVVHDDYRPMWKVPTLKPLTETGYNFKDTFNEYVKRVLRKNPRGLWEKMNSIIVEIYQSKLHKFKEIFSSYPKNVQDSSFFEMVRFDFVLDHNCTIYLMEANMSPNLSSSHFPPNSRLYEQVIYSLLRLAGVLRPGLISSFQSSSEPEMEMQISSRDLRVYPHLCSSSNCSSCINKECNLCQQCLSKTKERFLRDTYTEHLNRHLCKRIYPSSSSKKISNSDLSHNDILLHQWIQGMCEKNDEWCTL